MVVIVCTPVTTGTVVRVTGSESRIVVDWPGPSSTVSVQNAEPLVIPHWTFTENVALPSANAATSEMCEASSTSVTRRSSLSHEVR